jgi:hypothetical protein
VFSSKIMRALGRLATNEGAVTTGALVVLVGLMARLHAPSLLCGFSALVVAHVGVEVSRALARRDGRDALEAAAQPLVLPMMLFLMASIDQLAVDVTRSPAYECGNATLWVPFALALAFWVGRKLQRELLDDAVAQGSASLVRSARGVAFACALILAGAGLHAAMRARRLPSLDGWVDAQPIVAVLPPVDVARVRGAPLDEAHRVGSVCVERRCAALSPDRYRCFARIARACDLSRPLGDSPHRRDDVSPTSSLRIRHNGRLDAWLIDPEGEDALAFQGSAFEQVVYGETRLSPELSPPLGWIVGALTASVLAFGLVWVSFARKPFDASGFQRAWHRGEGQLDLGGVSVFAPCAASLKPGDVIVRTRVSSAVPFRGAEETIVEEARSGSLDDAKECADFESAAPAMLALAVVATVGAPLALAVWLGIA